MTTTTTINSNIEFFVTSWHTQDIKPKVISQELSDKSSNSNNENNQKEKVKAKCDLQFVIRAFGCNALGQSCVLSIQDFHPYFFIKIPDIWNKAVVLIFISNIKEKIAEYHRDTLIEYEVVQYKDYYYFHGEDKFKFLKLTFSCISGFWKYQEIFKSGIAIPGLQNGQAILYQRYEANIQPLLRFMHERDLYGAGWIQIKYEDLENSEDFENPEEVEVTTDNSNNDDDDINEKLSYCQHEYVVKYDKVNKLEKSEIPKLTYLGTDIEVDSSHGDFPLAKKNYMKLARDIITAFNSLKIMEKQQKKNKIVNRSTIDYRQIILKWLNLAFDPYFNNNIIGFIKPFDLDSSTVNHLSQFILNAWQTYLSLKASSEPTDITINMLKNNFINDLHSAFEEHLPENESELSYLTLSTQFFRELDRLHTINNVIFKESPLMVISLLLKLPFYCEYHDINKVYIKEPIKPGIHELLVPTIYTICNDCYDSIQEDLRIKKINLTKKGKKLKKKDDQDKYIKRLTELLDKYYPELYGDPVIQIGSTFKRYGESDCYLKHIITLGKICDCNWGICQCQAITNQVLISHEYKDTKIPVKELSEEIASLLKNVSSTDDKTLELLKHQNVIDNDLKILISTDEDSLNKYVKYNHDEINNIILTRNYRKQLQTDKSEVIIEQYATEAEVLLAWTKLIQKEDPDIVIGYNVFGFDFKYLYERATILGITEEFCKLGRYRNLTQKLVEKKMSSSARGDNIMYYIDMHGRVVIDMYKVAQSMLREESYKLDHIAGKYMYKNKNDMPPKIMFIKQKGTNHDRREIAEYCLIDCILCNRLIDKFEIITNNIGMAQVCSVPMQYLFLRGQGIKLQSFVSKICRLKGFLIPVVEHQETEEEKKDKKKKIGYEGAIVLKPVCKIFIKPIVVGDFNSLYPSSMISENLSHDSYVSSLVIKKGENVNYRGKPLDINNKYDVALVTGQYPGWDYVDKVYDVFANEPVAPGRKKTKKVVIGHKICRFAQPPNGLKSVIPDILKTLLKSRADTRKIQKNYPKNSFLWNVYEGLQLAYKVTANSLYGVIGASVSPLALVDVSACTTATGREMIMFTKNYIENHYPGSEIVYGDTDSVFIDFNLKDKNGELLKGTTAVFESMKTLQEAAKKISSLLKDPQNLEMEKCIYPFILISKKRYHGHYYTTIGKDKFYPNSMGIVLKRRDNANITKHIFGGMIDVIMNTHDIQEAIQFIKTECQKLLNGEFPIDMFIETRTLKSYYKNPMQIAHNVLAMRIGIRDPGSRPNSNDRIPFVHIINEEPDALQGDKIEDPQFVIVNKIPIDYRFYLTNQIRNPCVQILALEIGEVKAEKLFDNILTEYDQLKSGFKKITTFSNIKVVEKRGLSYKLNTNTSTKSINTDTEEDDDNTDTDSEDDDNDTEIDEPVEEDWGI